MVEKFKTLIITLLSLAMVVLLFAFFAITAVSDALKLDDIVFELFRRGEKTEATFADNDAFAAVSSAGSMTFLVVGLFNGIAIGGGVIISKYYGAGDKENVVKSIHTNFLFGILFLYKMRMHR